MPDPLTQARTHLTALAADRQRRGTPTPPEHLEAAAALLVDLWATATRHGITPDHPAWSCQATPVKHGRRTPPCAHSRPRDKSIADTH
jgi:hypothetical protein